MKKKKLINMNGEEVYIVDERAYRESLIREARFKGCETEMKIIFDKYDRLLRNCTNMKEAEQIGTLGVMEISNLLDGGDVGIGGALIINNKEVTKK